MKTTTSFKLMLLAFYSVSCIWSATAQVHKEKPQIPSFKKLEPGNYNQITPKLKRSANTRTLNLNSSVSERLDSMTSESDSEKIIFLYDENGNNIETKFWSIIDSTSILKNDYKVVNQYNSTNQITEQYTYFLRNDTLRIDSKEEYHYYPNGLLKTKIESYVQDNDTLIPSSKYEYTYNNNNKKIRKDYYYYGYTYEDTINPYNRAWQLNDKTEYTYNSNFNTIVSDNRIDSVFFNTSGKKTKASSYNVSNYAGETTIELTSLDSLFYDNENRITMELHYYKSYSDTIIRLDWEEKYTHISNELFQAVSYNYNSDSSKMIFSGNYYIYLDKSIKFSDIIKPREFFEDDDYTDYFFNYKILRYDVFNEDGTIKTGDLTYHYSSFKTTSLEENFNENSNFVVFPNPATDKITIQLSENTNGAKISILTSTGNIITETFTKSNQETLAIDHLKSGLYIIKIENGQKQAVQKVVVK